MSREAMELALEALESDPISHAGLVSRKQAITALRQALETEPVCWTVADGWVYANDTSQVGTSKEVNWAPIYTAPPKQWVGLTDQEVMVAAYQAGFDIHEDYEDDSEAMHWWTNDGEACDDSLLKLRDLIEAKLKEKNHG